MKKHAAFISKVLRSNLPNPRPYKLNFALTYHCNHRCLNCNIWKLKPKNELTSEEIDNFFKNYQFSWINLTGGEIFMRTDFDQIIKSIFKYNKNLYILTMTTNGLLTPKIVEGVKKIKENYDIPFLMVTVSIDGDKNKHNEVRGLPIAYQQAMKTIIELKKIKGVKVQFGYSIYPENAGELPKFIKHMKKKFEDFSVNQMHINTYNVSGHYYGNNKENMKKLLKDYPEKAKADLNYFLSLYDRKLSYEHAGERAFQKFAIEFLDTNVMPLPCKSLETSVFLDPNGNIYPCIIWNTQLGNIRDVDYKLKELFKKPKYQELLKIIREKKCPNCWTVCEATQTMLGNLYKPKVIKNFF